MFTWLHISDFHTGKSPAHQATAFQRLLLECRAVSKKVVIEAVFLTGDVAQSGLSREYDQFVTQVLAPLRQVFPKAVFCCVPGNHDVDCTIGQYVPFSGIKKSEKFFLNTQEGEKARRSHAQRMSDYTDFVVKNVSPEQSFSERTVYTTTIPHKFGQSAVIGVCTAWFSEKDQNTKGALAVGIEPLEEAISNAIEAGHSPIFLLSHHPAQHLSDEHLSRFENALAKGGVIHLHGHVHQLQQRLVSQNVHQSHIQIGAGSAYQAPSEESTISKGAWRNGFTLGLYKFQPDGVNSIFLCPRVFSPQSGAWTTEFDAIPDGTRDTLEDMQVVKLLAPGFHKAAAPRIEHAAWDSRTTADTDPGVQIQVIPSLGSQSDPGRRKSSRYQALVEIATDIVAHRTSTRATDWSHRLKESRDDHQRYDFSTPNHVFGVTIRGTSTQLSVVELRGYAFELTRIENNLATLLVLAPFGLDKEIEHEAQGLANLFVYGPQEIEEFLSTVHGVLRAKDLSAKWAWSETAGNPSEFALRISENRIRYWLVRGGMEGAPDWATAFDASGNYLVETDPRASNHGASAYLIPHPADGTSAKDVAGESAPTTEILHRYAKESVRRLDPLQLLGTAIKDAVVIPVSLSRSYVAPVLQSWDRLSDSLVTFEEMEEFLDSSGLTGAERERVRAELRARDAVGRPEGNHDLETAIQKTGVLLLLGEPGAGKTCLLRFRAIQICRRILDASNEAWDGPVPVFVPLAPFAASLTSKETNLHSYILSTAGFEAGFSSVLEPAFSEGRVQVFLDGLDEVIERDLRVKVSKAIDDFCARHTLSGNKILVTSRLAGYLGGSPLRVPHERLVLAPFSDKQVEELAKSLITYRMNPRGSVAPDGNAIEFSNCELSDSEMEEVNRRVATFRAGYEKHRGVRRLVRNPLLLSILLWMFGTRSELPKQRFEIYEVFTETLLHARNVTRGEQFRLVPIERELASISLREVAWNIQAKFRTGLIAWDDLVSITSDVFMRFDASAKNAAQCAERAATLLGRIREFGGVFVQRTSDNMWGFSHNTYQEYYAAMHLAGNRKILSTQFANRVPTPRWREVLLLALGKLGSDSEESAAFVHEISMSKDPAYERILARPLLFATDALQELRVCSSAVKREIGNRLLDTSLTEGKKSPTLRRAISLRLGAMSDLGYTEPIVERLRQEISAGGQRCAVAIDVIMKMDTDDAVRNQLATDLLVPLNREDTIACHAALTALTSDSFRDVLERPDVLQRVRILATTHSNRHVREIALRAMIYGDPDRTLVLEHLASALNDESPWVRIWALRGMRDRGTETSVVSGHVAKQMKSLGAEYHRYLMEVVSKLGDPEQSVIRRLIDELKSGNQIEQTASASLLGYSLSDSPQVRGALRAAAGSPDPVLKAAALQGLRTLWRETGRERGEEGWLARELLGSPRRDAKATGLRWAAELGLPKVESELVALVTGRHDQKVKAAALRAMAPFVGIPAIDECLLNQLKWDVNAGKRRLTQSNELVVAALRALEFASPATNEEMRSGLKKLSVMLTERSVSEDIRSRICITLAIHCGFDPSIHPAILAALSKPSQSGQAFVRTTYAVGDHLRRAVEQGALSTAWKSSASESLDLLAKVWGRLGPAEWLAHEEAQADGVWRTLQDIAEMMESTRDEALE